LGDLGSALTFYQKAVEIDPNYQVVYNDLGVIYEAMGESERAVASYLHALKIDPNYVSAYSNLALFYEDKRDLEKAAYYWGKRAELGGSDDLWGLKAQLRLKDIQLAKNPSVEIRPKKVEVLKQAIYKEKKVPARTYPAGLSKEFQDPEFNSTSRDYELAMQEALNSKFPDPFDFYTDKDTHI
jgi:tetratricopeptide (TPR) repeat protein